MLASLLAAGMPLVAQNLGSEYRLKRVIPVEGRQGIAADSAYYYVSGSTALYKYDKQGRLVAKNERPFEGLPWRPTTSVTSTSGTGRFTPGSRPSTTAAGRISRWRFTMPAT